MSPCCFEIFAVWVFKHIIVCFLVCLFQYIYFFFVFRYLFIYLVICPRNIIYIDDAL